MQYYCVILCNMSVCLRVIRQCRLWTVSSFFVARNVHIFLFSLLFFCVSSLYSCASYMSPATLRQHGYREQHCWLSLFHSCFYSFVILLSFQLILLLSTLLDFTWSLVTMLLHCNHRGCTWQKKHFSRKTYHPRWPPLSTV